MGAAGPQIQQQLVFTPYRASGIYEVGDTVGWKVSPGEAKVTHGYKWTIRRNNVVVLKEGRLKLSGIDKIEIVADKPGMIYVAIEAAESLSFELDALGSKVHGYIAKPAKSGKFPALIQLQYAGVYALNAPAVARRAPEGRLMINVDSHDKLPSDPSGNIPRDYASVGNTDREKSYFLNMYLRDSRAWDYVMTEATGMAKRSC